MDGMSGNDWKCYEQLEMAKTKKNGWKLLDIVGNSVIVGNV